MVGWTSAWLCALFGVGAALSVVAVFALGGYGNTVAKLAAASDG